MRVKFTGLLMGIFDHGTTTVSLNGGASIPVGSGSSVALGVTNASEHFVTYEEKIVGG